MADGVEQRTSTLCETDKHAWAERQITFFQDGGLNRLDRANLIAYLTDTDAYDPTNWDRGWLSSTPVS